MKKSTSYSLLSSTNNIALLSSNRYTSKYSQCDSPERPEVLQYLSSMFPEPIKVPEQAKLFQPNVASQGR